MSFPYLLGLKTPPFQSLNPRART